MRRDESWFEGVRERAQSGVFGYEKAGTVLWLFVLVLVLVWSCERGWMFDTLLLTLLCSKGERKNVYVSSM